MRLKIIKDKDNESVSICCRDTDDILDGFIDIYVDDELTPSLFKNLDDAELFAKIIVKLLEKVHDFS